MCGRGGTQSNSVIISSLFQEVKVLKNEIQILETLKHYRILTYYGSEEKDNHLHLYMEFMEGVSLSTSIGCMVSIANLSRCIFCDYFGRGEEGLI